MRKVNTWNLTIRSYEVGRYDYVDSGTFVNFFEEMAIRGSASVGYPNEWFEQSGYLWVIRKWMMRFYDKAIYNDELETRTWVSDFRRVQSHREYEILKGSKRVARARANWVFVDWRTLKPVRLLPEFFDAYQPSDETLEDLQTRLVGAESVPDPRRFISHRTVQPHELDKVWHVNNANYVRWAEDSLVEAFQLLGFDDRHNDWRVLTHEIDYKQSAQPGDQVVVTSWVAESTATEMAWNHEIYHATTGEILCSDYSIVAMRQETLELLLTRVTV